MNNNLFKCILAMMLSLICTFPLLAENNIKLVSPENNSVLSMPDSISFNWNNNHNKSDNVNNAEGTINFELIIWNSSEKVIFSSFCNEGSFELKKSLEPGDYLWSVRENDFKFPEKFKFTIGTKDVDNKEFQKTGNTLVVPVEFSDITFASEGTADFNSAINEKMKEMLDFYKKISWNASEIESELKWDIAPIYKSTETRAHYGRDVPTEKSNIHGLNYIVDAGDFGKSKAGSSALKKEACSYLVNEKKIPMRKYRHIIYFVPGDGGNTSPSDQIWPASNSAWPGAIIKIPFTDIVTGTTFAGIMQSIKKNTGTICHEFGHQFGLPDLYPFLNSNKLKERDLGVAGLMASGSHYGVGMTGMSKKRSYMGKSKKKNWLGKNRVVKIKENGQFKIYSRDSDDSPNLLLVSIKSTWDPDDYFIVELFDRIGPDKNMPAKIKKDGNYFSAAAGVFIYHSDDDDVEDIHYLKSLPVEHDWDKRFFMPGGVLEMLGVKIEIKDLTETENSWSALINVQYDDKVKKPEGFVNTVKGIGIFLKNKMKDLFISQSTPISKSK